jgi:glutamine synthetase
MSIIQQFFKEHGISEVEAIIPDMAGVPRGKIMPAEKFAEEEGMRLPESIFLQTVTGEYPDDERAISPSEIDIVLKADPNTIRVVPWAAEPTAQVLHDSFYSDGRPVTMAPRYVLQHVLELYAQHGWEPVVAPELEFFLVEPNTDADYPLKPPVGRSGRPEIGRQSYSIAAVNEFDPLFDDIYAFCEAQDIEIDTLIHEDGAAQMEINLLHGNALSLADQVFLFKRTAREAALRHKMYTTSWRSRWRASRAVPCTSIRASSIVARDRTCSAMRKAGRRRSSSRTSRVSRSTCRPRCRCSRRT